MQAAVETMIAVDQPHVMPGRLTQVDVTAVVAKWFARGGLGVDTDVHVRAKPSGVDPPAG